jgi:hypothetical protein
VLCICVRVQLKQRFEKHRKALLREYMDFEKESPYEQVGHYDPRQAWSPRAGASTPSWAIQPEESGISDHKPRNPVPAFHLCVALTFY